MWSRLEIRKPVGPTTTVGFTGDVLLKDYPDGAVSIGPDLRAMLWECDLVVANQEAPLTTAPRTKPQPYSALVAPPGCARQLKDMNVQLANLANNHMMDHGRDGLVETLAVLKSHGIGTHGAGLTLDEALEPHILDLPCGRLALLAFSVEPPLASGSSPGPAPLDLAEAKSRIASLVRSGHIVCVEYHGGREFTRLPGPKRRELFRDLTRAGAHMIIGNHAHVFQGVEVLDQRVIAYSLGNFYLNTPYQKKWLGTDIGQFVAVEIDAKGPCAVKCAFIRIDRDNAQALLLGGACFAKAEALFRDLCAMLDDDVYARAWRCDCLATAAALTRVSPTYFPGAFGKAFRALVHVLFHCKRAFRLADERELVAGAMRALPLVAHRRRFREMLTKARALRHRPDGGADWNGSRSRR